MTALERMRAAERQMGEPDGPQAAQDYLASKQRYRTHPHRRGADGSLLVMIMAGLIVVLVSLMIGHVVAKALSKLAAHNYSIQETQK